MSNDCFHPNPLVHGGSSQEQRIVPALDPATAPIDGRGMDEILLFLQKYGKLLNYYDSNNKIAGDWQPFIAHDLSTLLATMAVSKYDDCLATFYKYYNKIQDGNGTIPEARQFIKILFDIAFTLLDTIKEWNEKLVLRTPAKDFIYQEISSRLAYDLRDLLQYYSSAKPLYVDTAFSVQPGAEDFQPEETEQVIKEEFRQDWWAKFNSADIINSWDHYKTTYLPAHPLTKNIFSNSPLTGMDNFQNSSSYLRTSFTNIYNSYTRIINAVKAFFIESITNYPYHHAHNGLILAFLKLFGVEKKELNRLTDRHLNFYYKDVLRIDRKAPVPDAAHIVFTLAKNIPDFILDEGTELLGGKDKNGKALIYKTTESLTVNKSEVSSFKSVFLDEDPVAGGLFAAEISNSADGNGKELPKEDPSWFPFGSEQSGLAAEVRTMQEVEPGFLIASPVLQLSEGIRTVTIEININNFNTSSFAVDELAGMLDLSLTGKKDWIALPLITSYDINTASGIKMDMAGNRLTIKFTLDETVASVIPFSASIHKDNYDTQWPVLKCLIRKSADVSLIRKLSAVSIGNIRIGVKVEKAVSCIIHNDQGGLDIKNPFMPFGSRPKKNSSFYFGSQEVFSKKVTKLTLKISWLGLPEGSSLYDHYKYKSANTDTNYIDLANTATFGFTVAGFVKNGEELSNNPVPNSLFASNNSQAVNSGQELVFTSLFSESASKLDSFTEYSPSLVRGFLKLQLINPAKAFGHHVFSKVYTQQVIAVNASASTNSLPNEPYTPLWQPLHYSYEADETLTPGSDIDDSKGQFFHIFPFGFEEKNATSSPKLLQPFTGVDIKGTTHLLQGALYIGIRNIAPTQILSLYFEFNEGSEDASLDPSGILWSYLADNEWKLLDPYLLADTTHGFLGSGIVKLTIPDDMSDKHTILPSSQRWIRVAVSDLYKAYPKLLNVFTNSVKAVFDNKDNETSHLSAPLPAGTISKLLNNQPEIKKLLQPYDSFGGRMLEEDKPYYTRVSERLRHKNRAITIWDYERLVLEQFSFLYKAKCLNHTNDITETAPGCVRMIVIPDVSKKSTGNLFEPKISNNKRRVIKEYLAALNCPFADLQVQNPQFEAIKVKCEVRFLEGLDVTAHLARLKNDIDKFLAPWAFEEGRGIDFGGNMHRSQIIYFMERLPYVDFVTDFLMDVYINGSISKTNQDEIVASTSRSILTSFRNHQIGTNVCAT